MLSKNDRYQQHNKIINISKLHSMACSTNMHFLSKAPGVHRHHVTVWTPDPWNQGILNRLGAYSNVSKHAASRCADLAVLNYVQTCFVYADLQVLF